MMWFNKKIIFYKVLSTETRYYKSWYINKQSSVIFLDEWKEDLFNKSKLINIYYYNDSSKEFL